MEWVRTRIHFLFLPIHNPLELALILRSGAEKIRICCTTDTSTFCDTTGPHFGGYPRSFSTCVFPPASHRFSYKPRGAVSTNSSTREGRFAAAPPAARKRQSKASRALGFVPPAPLPGASLLSRREIERSGVGAAAQTSKLIQNGGIKNLKGKAIRILCLSWQPQEAQRVWGTVHETDGPCRSSEHVLAAGMYMLSLIFHFHKGRRG